MNRKLLITCPASIGRLSSVFYLADNQVRVSAPGTLINQLIKLCDGTIGLDRVIKTLAKRWNLKTVGDFISELTSLGIIGWAGDYSGFIWPFVKNPTRLFQAITDQDIARLVIKASKKDNGKEGIEFNITKKPLQEIIEHRRSIRTFSDNQVPQDIINLMLWSGYGIVGDHLIVSRQDPQKIKVWQDLPISRHTVPSAGALYPLRFGLALLRPTDQCAAGCYQVVFGSGQTIKLVKTKTDRLSMLQAFADPTVCNQAQGVITIAGSFKECGGKYGNRSLLYVPLEAGHAAQNIHLAASDNSIGTVEVGGFLEIAMRQAFSWESDYWPLTTILFGHPAKEQTKQEISSETIINWAAGEVKGYKLPFHMSFARLKNQKLSDSACGRSDNPELAKTKAIAEKEEWSACGRIPNDSVLTTFSELMGYTDPRQLVAYHPCQYQRRDFPLSPLNSDVKYRWLRAKTLGNRETFVLADCVLFPYKPRYPLYTFASSSGAAAHPDRHKAIMIAALELIEREAFMIAYLNRLSGLTVKERTLSSVIRQRLIALQRAGFKVVIKDLTLDLTPVAFVFAQNEDLTFTTCAGSSDFDYETALDHALTEVESAVYCRLIGKQSKPIKPRHVRFTDEHGNLYEQPRYFRQADFLGLTTRETSFRSAGSAAVKSWQELVDCLIANNREVIVVDLPAKNGGGITGLKTVKVFVLGLVPISFGYGVEPLGMQRVYDLPVTLGFLDKPKRYGELAKFPHPYT